MEVSKQASFEIEKPNIEGSSLDLKESSNEHYIEEKILDWIFWIQTYLIIII